MPGNPNCVATGPLYCMKGGLEAFSLLAFDYLLLVDDLNKFFNDRLCYMTFVFSSYAFHGTLCVGQFEFLKMLAGLDNDSIQTALSI